MVEGILRPRSPRETKSPDRHNRSTRSLLAVDTDDVKRSAPLLIFLVGCASLPPVPSGPPPVYRVGCPDVLDVSFRGKPEWDAVASVDVDGVLPLGPAGRPTVVGRTPEEAAEVVAATAGIEPARVSVTVIDPRANRVYITGPENGRRRVVAYHGPEPAYALLHRVGAVPPGEANLHDPQYVAAKSRVVSSRSNLVCRKRQIRCI